MLASFRFFLGLYLFSFFSSTAQNRVIELNDDEFITPIGLQSYFLEDPSWNLKVNDVQSEAYQSKFEAITKDAPNFSSTASAYWIRFEVINKSSKEFYLEIGTAFMDSISLYEIDEHGKTVSVRHSGDDLPFEHREILTGNYLFKIAIPTNEKHTYFLRVKSVQPLFFPLRIGTLKSFMEYTHDLDYMQGIYFGFMIFIFLYNLFLYFKIKEKLYLLYIIYVFCITWFMASIFGYFFEYFWPQSPWINQNVVVSSGLTMIAATLFTQGFLGITKDKRWFYYISNVFLLMGILVCVFVIAGFKIEGLRLAQIGLLSMAIYFLYLGIHFRLKGVKEATYYLIAWGALLIGIIAALLESLNLMPVMPYLNAMQIGSALEALLLSFALGEKINTYKRQREEAMELALKSSKENEQLIKDRNKFLEEQVRIRTEEIEEQNEELKSLNDEKDKLMGVVAHDLRSPLNQIKGLIHIMNLDAEKMDVENQEMFGRIYQSADHMATMIKKILDVNAVKSRKINLDLSVLDLKYIVEPIVKNFDPSAKDKSIKLVYSAGTADKYLACVDKIFVVQILENLLSNALKFSSSESTVKITMLKKGNKVGFSVKDQGPGISVADQKKLYQSYQKLTATPTAGESSTGLGLSIVKEYVDAMKGEIVCESTLGEGTIFTILFDAKI